MREVSQTHIHLFDEGSGQLVQLLVEQLLLALLKTSVFAAVLLEEVLEHVLGEEAHNLAKVLRHVHLTDMADHVGQTILGDIDIHLGDELLQLIAVGHRLGKELVAPLGTLLLGKALVLALDDHTTAVAEIHGHHRTDDDALADVVVEGRQTQPTGDLAGEGIGVLEAFVEGALEQGLGVEEALGLEELVHLLHGQVAAAVTIRDIDVEAVELMAGGVIYALLDNSQVATRLNVRVRIATAKQFAEHGESSGFGMTLFHSSEEAQHLLPVAVEQLLVVVESLTVVEHGGALGKPHLAPIAKEAGVGTMHFLLHHILQRLWHLSLHTLHILTVEVVLNGAVLLE